MNTPITDFLKKYTESKSLRLHMPGGKGLLYPHDITEIDGADVLYESEGIIRESERNAAALFGAAETAYSCGGATLAIQSMLAAACEVTGKRRIAAGRYSHKSLICAAVLLGLDVDFVCPDSFLGADITPEAAANAISGDTAALFVNSIDYLGGQSDIAALSELCKSRGVLLAVDNAHGAYKVFTGDHPLALGADMTADSAHKTLPALTGAAYLHLADSSLLAPAKAAMSLFGSSSPSYLMLESLDNCNLFISEKKQETLAKLQKIGELGSVLEGKGFTLKKSDPMRITIDANAAGYTGTELGELLRSHGAECEMCGSRYVVMLFSAVQPDSDLSQIERIMNNIPLREPIVPREFPVLRPEKVMTPRDAYFSASETIPVSDSAGRICAGICSPCPPCVPIVMPGERISAAAAGLLKIYGVDSIRAVR